MRTSSKFFGQEWEHFLLSLSWIRTLCFSGLVWSWIRTAPFLGLIRASSLFRMEQDMAQWIAHVWRPNTILQGKVQPNKNCYGHAVWSLILLTKKKPYIRLWKKSKTIFWSLKDLFFNNLILKKSVITLESPKDLAL